MLISSALCITLIVACGPTPERHKTKILTTPIQNVEDGYEIQDIDSCEYITGWSGQGNGGPFGMHKGNCKYCKKRMEQMFQKYFEIYMQKMKK